MSWIYGTSCKAIYLTIVIIIMLFSAELFLTPRIGNQLGGTPVLVHGFCLDPDDIISCKFGDQHSRNAVYLDSETAFCISPVMTAAGTLDFTIEVRRTLDMQTRRIEARSSFSNGIH